MFRSIRVEYIFHLKASASVVIIWIYFKYTKYIPMATLSDEELASAYTTAVFQTASHLMSRNDENLIIWSDYRFVICRL